MPTDTAPTPVTSTSTALTKSNGGALDRLHAMVSDLTPTERATAIRGVSSVGGGIAGAYLWSRHRVLGFFAGAALAGAAAAVAQGKGAREVAHRLVPTATATAGSLLWRRHPVLGFIGGGIAGGIAAETMVDKLASKFGA